MRQLADDAITWESWLQFPDSETLRQDYSGAFFAGYIESDNIDAVTTERDPGAQRVRAAFDAGRAYRIKHPETRKDILAGFGYTEVELVGTWLSGMEASMLFVDDRPNRRIWVWLMKNVDWVRPEAAPGVEQRVRVRMTGLLSEPGRYGHLGTFDRQLLVSQVVALTAATPAEAAASR